MLDYLLLSAALSLGQSEQPSPVRPLPLAPPPGTPALNWPAAPPIPATNPAAPGSLPLRTVSLLPQEPTAPQPTPPAEPAAPAEAPAEASPEPIVGETPREAPESQAQADRWWLMRSLQGTWLGSVLDDHRMAIYGWTEASYTASTNDVSNQPYVWNDRANEFLLQQHWIRFERTVVTSGTTEPTFGFRSDWLIGSDYRFSLPRGIWNSQLQNATGTQNLYGVDPIAFYGEMYIPTLFQGSDFKAGRYFTPFGAESLEAVSTPLLSRSYAFNFCPPFTHTGVLGTFNLSPVWTAQAGWALGNDVFVDPSDESRFVGTIKYTRPGGRDVVTFGTSIGRGKMNTGDTFFPATVALAWEPAGRNNINVFDLVWAHTINPQLTYTLEVIYGYQTGVPANVPGGIIDNDSTSGTAQWGSICEYLTYVFNPRLSTIFRWEFFDDFNGQRTGFEGLYTELTWGVQVKPRSGLLIRPEIRWDYNGYSQPFEGKNYLFTAATDIIVRW